MENIEFKKSKFGGFDPEDVMSYIRKITDEFSKAKKELKKEKEALKKELEKCRAELRNSAETITGLENDIKALTEEKEALSAKVEELNTQSKKNLDFRQMLFEVADSLKNLVTDKPPQENGEQEAAAPVSDLAEEALPADTTAAEEPDSDDEEDINDLIKKYS